ncbi:MAG: DoxX family protein [Bacteroidetes bacterium]|nr:DoxX family protein [Bacteroidota bacterium]
MTALRTICRFLIGLVFIFSGFVKGLDPTGTMFKIEDYFIAFGMEWAIPMALALSILLCTVEFSIGMLLILNVRIKLVTWVLFLMMAGFTVMTFFDAIYNPVPDCGCFGDAIKLTNWQTFYKNVVLMVFVLIIVFTGKKAHSVFSGRIQNMMASGVIVLFACFCIYSYNRLPVIDFLNWKVGRDMAPPNARPAQTYLVYKNKASGITKEYLTGDLPWQDTVWMSQWEFVESRTQSPGSSVHDLQLIDSSGADVTRNFIENPGFQFLLVSYNLIKANRKALLKMNAFYRQAEQDGHSFILITNASDEDIRKYREQYHPEFEIYNADDVALKMMIRSNPGLLLLKDGVVIQKWHYHYFLEYGKIRIKYMEGR